MVKNGTYTASWKDDQARVEFAEQSIQRWGKTCHWEDLLLSCDSIFGMVINKIIPHSVPDTELTYIEYSVVITIFNSTIYTSFYDGQIERWFELEAVKHGEQD
jgi:hypothetical protein